MGNIIGESFRPYVANQIVTRQNKLGKNNNSNGAFAFLSGNTPFLKLTSGIDVSPDKCSEIGVPESYAGSKLAENFIMFGGTSFKNANNITQQRIGVTSNYDDLFSNAAYGMVSNSDYGLVPMPGLLEASVKSLNRGSLRECEIKLRCFNTLQFNIIETLFLRLKYSFLLEWGHTIYYDNEGNVVTNPISNSEYYLEGGKTQKEVLTQLEASRDESSGNYDAFLGYVVNFNWNLNPDGSYDVVIKGRTPGDVIESLKINVLKHDSVGTEEDDNDEAPSIEKDKDKTTLNLIFNALREKATENDATLFGWSLSEVSVYVLDNIFSSFLKEKIPSLPELTGDLKNKYQIYIAPENKGAALDTSGFLNLSTENSLLDNLGFLLDATSQFLSSLPATRELVRLEFGFDDDSTGEEQLYIKFGALCRIIEQYCLMYDTGNTKYPPIVGIDSDYKGNYCFTVPEQFSTDPRICMIPITSQEEDKEDLNQTDNAWNRFWSWAGVVDDAAEKLEALNTALSTEFKTRSPYVGNMMHIHINANYVSDILSNQADAEGNLSLYDFFTTLLQGVQRSLGGINSFEVIYNEDTNEIKFMDNTQIPGVWELQSSDSVEPEPTRINVNTFRPNEGSFVKDVSIKSEISKDLANMMTIGAQANGNVVGENATAFSHWNKGLTDRVVKQKQNSKNEGGNSTTTGTPPNPPPETPEEKFAKYREQVLKYLLRIIKFKLDEDDIETYSTSFKPYLNYIVGSLSQPGKDPNSGAETPPKIPPVGFIPLSLDINMLGISGIKVYQKYTINEQLLPPNYVNKIEFITKGVSHNITPNGWTTIIDGQTIPKNDLNSQSKAITQRNTAKGISASSTGNASSNKTSNQTNPYPVTSSGDTPNADRLRAVIAQVGFHEKKQELSSGGDITKETADYGIQLVRTVAAETGISLVFTGGNDRYHQNITRYTSRHKSGTGLDFVILPRPQKIREVPVEQVKKFTRAQAQSLYSAADQARIKQIEDILKGFSAANPEVRYKNEYYNPTLAATGPHFHTSWGLGTEATSEQNTAIAEANAGLIRRRPLA